MSVSEAVVKAVREALTAHDPAGTESWITQCRCGFEAESRGDLYGHQDAAVAAAAEAAALEAAAEAVAERVPYGAELLPDGREDPAMVTVVQAHHEVWQWLRERAETVREVRS